MIFWRCTGKIAKYDRPCPQKLMFFSPEAMAKFNVTEDQLHEMISIKCPRCGKISGVDTIIL